MSEKTNSFLLCTDLEPYSHDCFSKISRTLFDFLNNVFGVTYTLSVQYSSVAGKLILYKFSY